MDQNADRQLDGVALDRVFTDSASGRSTARPELEALLTFVRDGDTDVNGEVCARLGGALASVLMLDLGGLKADSADALGQLTVVLLALFAKWNGPTPASGRRTPGAVAAAHGRQVGRPSLLDPAVLAFAVHLLGAGDSPARSWPRPR